LILGPSGKVLFGFVCRGFCVQSINPLAQAPRDDIQDNENDRYQQDTASQLSLIRTQPMPEVLPPCVKTSPCGHDLKRTKLIRPRDAYNFRGSGRKEERAGPLGPA